MTLMEHRDPHPVQEEIAALVLAGRVGDEKALRILFDRFAPRMLGVCRRYLGRRDHAEDALSTSFAKAFDKLHTLSDPVRFEPWLKRLVVNECIDTLRKERKFLFVDPEVEAVAGFSTSDAIHALGVRDLLRLMDELPPGYRTVFNLVGLEGFGHAEVAEMLGISESTSKTQYKKAREALQRKLESLPEKTDVYGPMGK